MEKSPVLTVCRVPEHLFCLCLVEVWSDLVAAVLARLTSMEETVIQVNHRRRIKTEKKAKVVAFVWGTEFS